MINTKLQKKNIIYIIIEQMNQIKKLKNSKIKIIMKLMKIYTIAHKLNTIIIATKKKIQIMIIIYKI